MIEIELPLKKLARGILHALDLLELLIAVRNFIVLCLALFCTPIWAQTVLKLQSDTAAARSLAVLTGPAFGAIEGVQVELKTTGTISAIEAVADGHADLAFTLRMRDPLNSAEAGLVYRRVAWDGLVLVAHSRNPVNALSLKQVQRIYKGKITNWSELGGPNHAINLYAVAGPRDGVEYSFRRLMFGNGNAPVAAGRWYLNTKQLEDAVAIDPMALGVSVLSGVSARNDLQMLAVENVAPSLNTVGNGEYLLLTPVYVVRRGPAIGSSAPQRFLKYLRTSRARGLIRRSNLLPVLESRRLTFALPERELWISEHLSEDVLPEPLSELLSEDQAEKMLDEKRTQALDLNLPKACVENEATTPTCL